MFQESAPIYLAAGGDAGSLQPIYDFIGSYRLPLMAIGLTILAIVLILVATKGGVKTLAGGRGSEGNSSALRETTGKTVAILVCAAILGAGTFGLGLAAQLGQKAGGDQQRKDVNTVLQDLGGGGEGAG